MRDFSLRESLPESKVPDLLQQTFTSTIQLWQGNLICHAFSLQLPEVILKHVTSSYNIHLLSSKRVMRALKLIT